MNIDTGAIFPVFAIDGRQVQLGVRVHNYVFGGHESSPVVAVGVRASAAAASLVHVSGTAAGQILAGVSLGETRQGGVRFDTRPRPVSSGTAVVVMRDEKEYARYANVSMTAARELRGSRHYSNQIDFLFGGDVSGCVCGSEMCKAKLPLSALDHDRCPTCHRHIQPSFARKAFPGKWIKEGLIPAGRDRWVYKEGIALVDAGQIFSLATSLPAGNSTFFYRWDGKDKIKVWDATSRIEEVLDAS